MGNIVNRVFDSSGPEGKVRGTPQQIIDKYLLLARDAQLSNDRVAAENFLQHAEHYTRMLGEAQRELAAEQEARRPQGQGQNGHHGGGGQDRFPQPRRDEGERRGPEALGGAADVIDFDEGADSGLVETPESRPEPRPESRPESRSESRHEPRPEPRQEPRMQPRIAYPPRVGNARPDEEPAPAPAADPAPEAAGKPRLPRRRGGAKPEAGTGAEAASEAAAEKPGTGDKPARAPRTRGPRKPRAAEGGAEGGNGAQDVPKAPAAE